MKRIILVILCVLLSSCGPTIRRAFDNTLAPPRKVAFLPPQFPDSLRPERAAIIRSQLESKLSNIGYLIVERQVVDAVCKDAQCENRDRLVRAYGIDAFIETSVTSATKNGFLAGYVDELLGELTLRDPKGAELFRVSHLETERGGLLFNSGQLIEAFRTQVEHSGDAPFEILAAKFAREVAAKFPRPQSVVLTTAPTQDTIITRTTLKKIKSDVFEICAEGSAGILASALIQGSRTTLREISPGRYCGIYWLGPKLISNVQVEVRSHYGQAVRTSVSLDSKILAQQKASAI